MTTPRTDPSTYPREYILLLRKALREGEVEITLPSHRVALRRRNILYSLRNSIYANPDFDPRLALLLPTLTFNVEDSTLYVRKQADTPD